MTTSNLNISIDDDLKHQAKVILDGSAFRQAKLVKMLFLAKSKLNIPNGEYGGVK